MTFFNENVTFFFLTCITKSGSPQTYKYVSSAMIIESQQKNYESINADLWHLSMQNIVITHAIGPLTTLLMLDICGAGRMY